MSTQIQTQTRRVGQEPLSQALGQAAEALPFTDREREIVMLLAAGLSNRQVAERLTLSVRTVESHIYRAMAKTGTRGRDELIELLNRRRAGVSGKPD